MKDNTLEQSVRDAAQYIRDRRRSAHLWEKRANDHAIIKKKLDRVQRRVESALTELGDLQWDTRFHERWFAYSEVRQYVQRAREQIGNALGPLSDAQVIIRRPPPTRSMREQQTALRLAEAIIGATHPRKVRGIARRIMMEADIQLPTDEAMTKWLRQIRQENAEGESRAASLFFGAKP